MPGPGDPGPANVLPRPALPAYFTSDLRQLLPTAVFASNPCRMRLYTQEVVLFRSDLQNHMRRLCLIPPTCELTHMLQPPAICQCTCHQKQSLAMCKPGSTGATLCNFGFSVHSSLGCACLALQYQSVQLDFILLAVLLVT